MAADPNTNELLRKILLKTEENNELLKKMHRAAIWARIFRIIYWLVILGVALGAYYFIQPYIMAVWDTYQSISSGVSSTQEVATSTSPFGGLFQWLGF